MGSLCQVCSKEPSKYKCPTCKVQSCSLACSRAHKTSCIPQPAPPASSDGQSDENSVLPSHQPNDNSTDATLSNKQHRVPDFEDLEKSQQLKELFTRFPNLRSRLLEIYKLTLEEEWIVSSEQNRGHRRGRGKGSQTQKGVPNIRGQWTAEKGLNRGLDQVRQWRNHCENGASGIDDEGFMRFISLVLGENETDERKQLQPGE
ncbi:hypothetical protein VTO42DRAFT_2952 [Malbranchea cinnamomea]